MLPITRYGLLLLTMVLLAPSARATTFSFGDIAASDVITSITLAADDGTGGATLDFDTSNNSITITSSVTQINFANKAAISGIPIGDVIFSSQVFLNGSYTFIPGINPTVTLGDFTNGAADFTIWDVAGGTTKVLEADYDGAGLRFQARLQVGTVLGEMSGDFTLTGGDADAQSAFGSTGSIDQIFPITQTLNSNLCGIITNCPVATDWLTFSANPTTTLQATSTPEPGSTLLLLGAPAALALRRLTRRP